MQLEKTDKAKLKGSDEKMAIQLVQEQWQLPSPSSADASYVTLRTYVTRAARVAVCAIRDHLRFALFSVTIRITRDQLMVYG